MIPTAFPSDARIAWFWYNDQEIFFDSEEEIGRKIEKFREQGITHLITFGCTHFRWNFKPWWPQINACIGKIVRQAHLRGIKVIEHHSSELIDYPDTPERRETFVNAFAIQNGFVKNYPGLLEYMVDESRPCMSRLQTDPFGKLQRTAYDGYGHCFNNADYVKEYLEYLEGVYATGVDGIMTDDVQYFGQSCFCETCRRLFREKYGTDMPLGEEFIKLQEDIRHPLFQKYMEFRVDSILRFHKVVADHMKSLGLRLLRPNYISAALSGGAAATARHALARDALAGGAAATARLAAATARHDLADPRLLLHPIRAHHPTRAMIAHHHDRRRQQSEDEHPQVAARLTLLGIAARLFLFLFRHKKQFQIL